MFLNLHFWVPWGPSSTKKPYFTVFRPKLSFLGDYLSVMDTAGLHKENSHVSTFKPMPWASVASAAILTGRVECRISAKMDDKLTI